MRKKLHFRYWLSFTVLIILLDVYKRQLGWCVIPFIIPDIIKIVLAYGLSRKLRKFVA